jgi:excisionase family DNA binding protein
VAYLQISDRTVRRLIHDGELNGYRMGRSGRVIRVDLNEIDEQLMRPMNTPSRARKRRTRRSSHARGSRPRRQRNRFGTACNGIAACMKSK